MNNIIGFIGEHDPIKMAIISPHIMHVGAFLAFIITWDPIILKYLIGSVLIGEIGNSLLKKLLKSLFPDTELFLRPNPPETGCGLFPVSNYDPKSGYGMPSGHTQMAFIAATFWSLYIFEKYGSNDRTRLSISLLFIIASLIGVSRVVTGCHNILQIIVGAVLGVLSGYIVYKI